MTTLITASIIASACSARLLPVSALPRVDFPTIAVTATCPARARKPWRRRSPASSSASSRRCRHLVDVVELVAGHQPITIQFDLNRNIDAAALDVQTALTIAQRRLPIEMTIPPSFRKVNPAEFPVLFVVLGSSAAAVGGQRIWRDHHRPDPVADSGRRPGQRLRRAEIRHSRPGRPGSRRGARLSLDDIRNAFRPPIPRRRSAR